MAKTVLVINSGARKSAAIAEAGTDTYGNTFAK